MDLWNVKNLEPPASSSCKLKNHDINLQEVTGLMNDALNLFSGQIFLDAESKLLHNIVKLNKLKYRKDIGFKYIQKLNRCVRNYDEFDYKSLIAWFLELLPSKYESDTYFPSRNMLHFFLVRTQGLGKLCVRLIECARHVYIHWVTHLNRGHSIGHAIVIIAVQARLFIIFRYLLQCTCHLYDSLAALQEKVPNTKCSWLPAEYPLPRSLLAWLDAEWVFKERVRALKGRQRTLFTRSVFDEEDVEFCQEYQIIEDDEDLHIVNEYLNILDSDEEDVASPAPRVKVEEIDEDLAVVTEQVRNTIGVRRRKVKPQVINLLEDEIGEPVDAHAKLAELFARLKKCKTLEKIEQFIQDGSHQYFRSMGMERYNHLLSMVQMHKESFKSLSSKSKRNKLRQEKLMIRDFVKRDAQEKLNQT